jgi:hypothetical protein
MPCNVSESNGMMGASREGDIRPERDGVAQVEVYERTSQTQRCLFMHSCCCGERSKGRLNLVRTQIHAAAYSFDLTLLEKVVNLVFPQACGASVAECKHWCEICYQHAHLPTLYT